MKKLYTMIMLSFAIMGSAIADKPKTYDARGMNIRERLNLMKQIREDSRKDANTGPQDKAKVFFEDLKTRGAPALTSAKKGSMIEDATTDFVDQEMQKTESRSSGMSKIGQALSEKDGEIKKYKKVGEDETLLNGTYYKTRYLIEYKNGKTQTVEMLYIKPTVTGEYILTEFNVE